MPDIKGVNIREVWDYRLSTASPLIDRRTGTWVVQIWSKNAPDYNPAKPLKTAKPLEEHDTGIPVEKGDEYNTEKLKVCYEWLKSVRDKYSRKDIEEIKPLVAKINAANDELAQRGAL